MLLEGYNISKPSTLTTFTLFIPPNIIYTAYTQHWRLIIYEGDMNEQGNYDREAFTKMVRLGAY